MAQQVDGNKYFQVGRVVSKDNGFMIIEIMKDKNDLFTIQEGDRFYTLMFVQQIDDRTVQPWIPWEADT